jgi:upstream activation factor subunit UAF30
MVSSSVGPGSQEGKQVRFEAGTGIRADDAGPSTTDAMKTLDTTDTMGKTDTMETMETMDTMDATNAANATPCPSAGVALSESELGSPAEGGNRQMPSDEEIQVSLKQLIAVSDLAAVTPRLLRKSLESQYGVSMKMKKGIIKETIQSVVQLKGEEVLELEAMPEAGGADGADGETDDSAHSADAATGDRKSRRHHRFGDILSHQMAEFLGMERCSRQMVVKKLWIYIKENKLQDPKDGRKILFDDRLAAVFGENGRRKSMTMLSMNKLLTKHVRVDDGGSDASLAGPAKKAKKTMAAPASASETKSAPKAKAKGVAAPASGAKSGNSKKGMMTKELELSEDLQKLVGAPRMTRAEVTKRFWLYIKERDLLDPKDKRFVLTDDLLGKLTGKKRFKAFGFQKLFSRHMWEEGEVL